MTIILPKPTMTTENLPQLRSNTHPELIEELLERLGIAVHASAVIHDPLAFTLDGKDRMEADLDLYRALDWLMSYAPIDIDGFLDLAHVSADWASDLRREWLTRINALAEKLIADNYRQGWEDNNSHPAFKLTFVPVTLKDGSNCELYPMEESHWALFVQAAMVKHRQAQLLRTEQYSQQPEYVQCTAFIQGAAELLADKYFILGRTDEDGGISLSSRDPIDIASHWKRNIRDAASLFEGWRAQQ